VRAVDARCGDDWRLSQAHTPLSQA
jgi:hypothetical protein